MTVDNSHNSPDLSMVDLFKSEVETHVAILNENLLALENDPEATNRINALMSAAHSIKGGARIMDLDPAVRIAHTMEDCFVEIQDKKISLTSDDIDILLSGVDMLVKIAEKAESRQGFKEDEIKKLIDNITAIVSKDRKPGPVEIEKNDLFIDLEKEKIPDKIYDKEKKVPLNLSVSQPPDSPSLQNVRVMHTDDSCPVGTDGVSAKSRMVRVAAEKMERLMGLAGEVVVNAQWFPAFFDDLVRLKRTQAELISNLEELHKFLARKNGDDKPQRLIRKIRDKAKICGQNIGERLIQLDKFTRTSATLSDRLYHEVIGVRMCPLGNGTKGFARMIRDMARELGKKARLEITGENTEVDRDILDKLDSPMTHLLRNAIDHGIELPSERVKAGKPETGIIRLDAFHQAGMLMIVVSDDGRGIDFNSLRQEIVNKGLEKKEVLERLSEPELLKFLFLPGFSSAKVVTEISGRGYGLNAVDKMVHEVGGMIRVTSVHGKGSAFHLELPLTLSVIRTFLVDIGGEPYAFPLARIERCIKLSDDELEVVEDRYYFELNDENVALINIHEVLEINKAPKNQETIHAVLISDRVNTYGLVVDAFLGESDLVVQPISSRLGKIPDISSAAVMEDGSPVLIFDVEDLINSIASMLAGRGRPHKIDRAGEKEKVKAPKRILVVEDSFIVREKERKLLENKGYEVEVAVDGMDGWNLLRIASFDMVLTDIDMPRMNGFELIRKIKSHDELKSLPVIIVSYKMNEEDRLKGLEAGADYYLHKTDFDDNLLIDAVIDLIGEAG